VGRGSSFSHPLRALGNGNAHEGFEQDDITAVATVGRARETCTVPTGPASSADDGRDVIDASRSEGSVHDDLATLPAFRGRAAAPAGAGHHEAVDEDDWRLEQDRRPATTALADVRCDLLQRTPSAAANRTCHIDQRACREVDAMTAIRPAALARQADDRALDYDAHFRLQQDVFVDVDGRTYRHDDRLGVERRIEHPSVRQHALITERQPTEYQRQGRRDHSVPLEGRCLWNCLVSA